MKLTEKMIKDSLDKLLEEKLHNTYLHILSKGEHYSIDKIALDVVIEKIKNELCLINIELIFKLFNLYRFKRLDGEQLYWTVSNRDISDIVREYNNFIESEKIFN